MKLSNLLLISYLAANVSGCAAFIEHNTPAKQPSSSPKIVIIKPMPKPSLTTLGYIEITGDTCVIYLARYPQCLQHEIRHCFEGNFHEGRESSEDC